MARYDCKLPIGLRQTNGALTKGTYTTPTLEKSDIPGLLGLEALMAEKAVIDFSNLKIYFCGPGGVEIKPGSGATEYQGVLSPSGHLMLPCAEFDEQSDATFTLATESISLISSVPASSSDQGGGGARL